MFIVFKNNLIDLLNLFPHFCLFDKLTGIECPVCGTTRGICELTKGNLILAYKLNISSFFVSFYFILQIPLRVISLMNDNLVGKIEKFSILLGNLILILVAVNWGVKFILYHY